MSKKAKNEIDAYMDKVSKIIDSHAPKPFKKMKESRGEEDAPKEVDVVSEDIFEDAADLVAGEENVTEHAPEPDEKDAENEKDAAPFDLDDVDLLDIDDDDLDALFPDGSDLDDISEDPTAEQGSASEPSADVQVEAAVEADTAVEEQPLDEIASVPTAEEGLAEEPSADVQKAAAREAARRKAEKYGFGDIAPREDKKKTGNEVPAFDYKHSDMELARLFGVALKDRATADLDAAEEKKAIEDDDVIGAALIDDDDSAPNVEMGSRQLTIQTADDNALEIDEEGEPLKEDGATDDKRHGAAGEGDTGVKDDMPQADVEIDPLPFADDLSTDDKVSSIGSDDEAFTWAKVPAIYDALGNEICLDDEMAYLNEYSSIGPVIGIGYDCFFTLALTTETRRSKKDSYGESEKVQWMLKNDDGTPRNVFFHYKPDTIEVFEELARDKDYELESLVERFRLFARKERRDSNDVD